MNKINPINREDKKQKKIIKKKRNYQWKCKWIRFDNAVKSSKGIWQRKYVKVKIN